MAGTQAQEKLRHGEQQFTPKPWYIEHITVMSRERYDASNHPQHDCLCMLQLVQLTTQKASISALQTLSKEINGDH